MSRHQDYQKLTADKRIVVASRIAGVAEELNGIVEEIYAKNRLQGGLRLSPQDEDYLSGLQDAYAALLAVSDKLHPQASFIGN